MHYSPHGHYLLITAAGVLGETSYPKWLRTYLIVIVSFVWAGLLIGSAVAPNVTVPYPVHVIMGVVVASLFRVEFGGIKLIKKEDE